MLAAATLLGWAAGRRVCGRRDERRADVRPTVRTGRYAAADRGDRHRGADRCNSIFNLPHRPGGSPIPPMRRRRSPPKSPSTDAADIRTTRCKSPGPAGRTSCGAPMCGPMMTGCSPPRPAWCFSDCSRFFPPLPRWSPAMGCSPIPSTIGDNLQTLSLMLPEGSFQIVQDQIARVLMKGNTALGATFLFGLALARWSANAGVKAVIDALNVVYEEREKRSFVRLNLISLAFTCAGIAALLLMVSAVVALPAAARPYRPCAGEPDHHQPGAMAAVAGDPAGRARSCSTGSDRAGGRRAGNGSASARWRPRCSGSRVRRCCPGTCRTSQTTARPMARSAPRSA